MRPQEEMPSLIASPMPNNPPPLGESDQRQEGWPLRTWGWRRLLWVTANLDLPSVSPMPLRALMMAMMNASGTWAERQRVKMLSVKSSRQRSLRNRSLRPRIFLARTRGQRRSVRKGLGTRCKGGSPPGTPQTQITEAEAKPPVRALQGRQRTTTDGPTAHHCARGAAFFALEAALCA
ncbi:hypothetical protein LZ30DRAFT_736368 [Colletotrichum cereale]|nr:hypothetical protein LZ30DRAFT_736368 [Colletotrichum cereale]